MVLWWDKKRKTKIRGSLHYNTNLPNHCIVRIQMCTQSSQTIEQVTIYTTPNKLPIMTWKECNISICKNICGEIPNYKRGLEGLYCSCYYINAILSHLELIIFINYIIFILSRLISINKSSIVWSVISRSLSVHTSAIYTYITVSFSIDIPITLVTDPIYTSHISYSFAYYTFWYVSSIHFFQFPF